MKEKVTNTISTMIPWLTDDASEAEVLRVRGGLIFSAAYLAVVGLLVAFKWSAFLEMPLNELGDFFAGAFGPLALLWLVLGYFQQGEELRQNTEALRLQATELANSVKEQQALVSLTNKQLQEDIEHRAKEAAARHRRSQPLFRFVQAGGGPAGGMHTVQFQLENVGAPCTNVVFGCDVHHFTIMEVYRAERIETGKYCTFRVGVQSVKNLTEGLLTIGYFDAEYLRQSQTFFIFPASINGSLDMTIEPTPSLGS